MMSSLTTENTSEMPINNDNENIYCIDAIDMASELEEYLDRFFYTTKINSDNVGNGDFRITHRFYKGSKTIIREDPVYEWTTELHEDNIYNDTSILLLNILEEAIQFIAVEVGKNEQDENHTTFTWTTNLQYKDFGLSPNYKEGFRWDRLEIDVGLIDQKVNKDWEWDNIVARFRFIGKDGKERTSKPIHIYDEYVSMMR